LNPPFVKMIDGRGILLLVVVKLCGEPA